MNPTLGAKRCVVVLEAPLARGPVRRDGDGQAIGEGMLLSVSGRRHLTPAEAVVVLRRGANAEQYLGSATSKEGVPAVRWLTAGRSGRSYELRLHEVEDVGTDDFLDMTEFPPLDPDEYIGEGRPVARNDDPTALLAAAARFGAAESRWVNAGEVQDEYAASRPA